MTILKTLLIIAFVAILLPTNAQNTIYPVKRCHTVESNEALRAKHPLLETDDYFERWLNPLIEEYKQQALDGRGVTAVTTIPVIFHVIHDNDPVGTGDNISAALIQSQVTQLNNDFRKILGTSGHNSNAVGADTEIEFCLALVDENGATLAEPGIDRINRSTKGWTAPPYGTCVGANNNLDDTYIQNTIKPNSQWNPNDYLNIWLMDINCGVLGYAQFPSSSGLSGLNSNGGAANQDGVVFKPSTIGSTTMPNGTGAPYNEGRTATHEIGHFFGLRHIWGDGGCSVDDYCNDTPTSDAANFGCPTGHVSCSTTDMIENYMDYTDDDCMNIYTQDQKARMQVVLTNSPRRASLANSTACNGGYSNPITCNTTISSYPYTQGWESSFGNWAQCTSNDFDWIRYSGSTPSNGTGPSSASEGNYFVYVESSSPNYPNKTTIITGPCFDLSGVNAPNFNFQYHMLGASTMGSLFLEISTDEGNNWSTAWTKSGSQGATWNSESVDLSSYIGSTIRLRFRGLTGTGWKGDMAIDDVSLTTGTGGGTGCNDNIVNLTITLDQYGSETTWSLMDGNNSISSGGPYTNNTQGTLVTEEFCLPDGCYDFIINDAYGDGICCSYGNGSYTLMNGTETLASGGSFGSSETAQFCMPNTPVCPTIDFNTSNITSYGGSQDQGTYQVQDGGATLYMANNAWKKIDYNYTVTANTVIEFDFRSTQQAEIHGIGFDTNNSISSNYTFRVYGTQNWGIGNYDNYSPSSWTTYVIPVGDFYTGTFDEMVFAMDDDSAPKNGNSYFRNIKVYEGTCGGNQRSVVREQKTVNKLSVYPNPANNTVHIEYNHKVETTSQLRIIDMSGKTVISTDVNSIKGINEFNLSTHDVQNGTYLIYITDEHINRISRLIVAH